MTVLIKLSGVANGAGPTFNLYSSVDGTTFTSLATGINKTTLISGYTATVPNGTTMVRATSVGDCTNSYDVIVISQNKPVPSVFFTRANNGSNCTILSPDGENLSGSTTCSGTLTIVGTSAMFRALASFATDDGRITTTFSVSGISPVSTAEQQTIPGDSYGNYITLVPGTYTYTLGINWNNAVEDSYSAVDWIQP